MSELCIYCQKEIAETTDHVPPKAFYPRPRPSNLITVPACLSCNNEASLDEEYFLATFMFSEAGKSESGKKLWAEKLHRMYDKNLGIRRKIASSFKEISVLDKSKNETINRLAIEYDQDRINRTCSKIIRGLYFIEYGEPLNIDCSVDVELLDTRGKIQIAKDYNHFFHAGQKEWPGVFQYRHCTIPPEHVEGIWLLLFWDTHTFWGTTAIVT